VTLDARGQSPYLRVVVVGIDQLIAATGNFMVIWLCLTSLPTEVFGSFSYSWSSIALFVVLSRSLFGIPALLDAESKEHSEVSDMSSSLTGALVLGVLTAIVTLTLYKIGGSSENEVWILGLFFLAPLILFQDQVRYLTIATKNIKFAIFLDILILGCILVTVIFSKNSEFVGWNLIFGLALGYFLAALVFVFRVPIQFNLPNLQRFIRLDFRRRSLLVSDAFLAWGFGLASITLIRVGTGDSGIAIYNGLVFLFGPVALVTVFLTLGLQSEVVRTKGYLATRHKALLVAVGFSPVIWILVISYSPENFLEKLLGPTSELITANIIIFALAGAFHVGIEILNLFLRAFNNFGAISKLRLVTGVTASITLGLATTLHLEIFYFILSLAISNFVGLLLTIVTLRKIAG
jgi:hypothetical protein